MRFHAVLDAEHGWTDPAVSRASVCAKKFDMNEGLVNDLKERAWSRVLCGDSIVYRVRNIAA